jgi:hypothetical protein
MSGSSPVIASPSAIANPQHHVQPEVAEAMSARHRAALELLELQREVGQTSSINEEYGRALLQVYSSALEPLRIDADRVMSDLRGAKEAYHAKIAESLQRHIDVRLRFSERYSDLVRAIPEPRDPSFWWARTDAFDTAGHTFAFRDDGLHFWGGPKIDKWNAERHENFGAIAKFAISPDRIPPSPSGNYVSSPFVELFGGLTAYAPMRDWLQGHGIAGCDLILRQTLYQWAFGPEGPVAKIVGEAVSSQSLHNWEDLGASRTRALPGHQGILSVPFNKSQLAPADTLWADIEVRFDIHLKSAGALVWCDPEVLLRTFQWPLVAA